MMEVFRTIHGSRLYGLAHDGSDEDTFVVTFEDRGRARQSVHGDQDIVHVGWKTFLRRAQSGSHQSCEALFSTAKVWTDQGEILRPLIESMVLGTTEVAAKYERTIKSFSYGDFKKRRHAARLALNLAEIRQHGRFNPTMTQTEIVLANAYARLEGDELLHRLIP